MGRYLLKDNRSGRAVFKNLKNENTIAFDTETTSVLMRGENEEKVVSIVIATKTDSYYIPINHRFYKYNFSEKKIKKYLQPIFADTSKEIIAHNYNFDKHVLKRLDIEIKTKKFFDTLIAGRMVNENVSNSLEDCIERYLGVEGLSEYDDVVATVPTEVKKKAGLSASNKATIDLVDIQIAANYGVEDVEYLIPLKEILEEKLKEEGQYTIYHKYFVPKFSEVLFDIEEHGVKINKEKRVKMGIEMQKDLDKLDKKLTDIAGVEINYDSPIQLSEILYNEYSSDPPCDICKEDECNKPECEEFAIWKEYGHKNPNIDIREKSFNFPVPERTETKQPSSGKSALKKFKHYTPKNERQEEGLKFVKLLLEYKKLSKLKSTFVDGLKEVIYDDGRVHGSFNILGAKSGRLSSSDPNLQNLPSQDEDDKYRIRELFIADEGYDMLAFDFSNLEVRILAHFSQDEGLLDMFYRDVDAHGATSVLMFDLDCHPNEVKEKYPTERSMAKTLSFGLLYGMSSRTLYYTLMEMGVDLEDKELQGKFGARSGFDLAQVLYDKYFETFPKVKEFKEQQVLKAQKNGYVKTILGRKKRLPDINSDDYKQRGYSERLSSNAVIQGSAADVLIACQIKLIENERLNELGLQQLSQIHDEILFQVPKENTREVIPIIKKEMENPFNNISMNVPMKVDYDIGKNYGEAK